jgi:phage tail-like protein
MDANGTRFHLLVGAADWTRRLPGDPVGPVSYDGVREQLTLRSEPFRFPQRQGDRPPQLSDRRGADRDAFGNLYWVDASGRAIRVQSAGSGQPSLFWEPGTGEANRAAGAGGFGPRPEAGTPPGRSLPLGGLAVTEDHYLAVGTLAPKGLLVFDLHAPAPPRQDLWPTAVDFEPFDLCARAGGGVFVLDRRNRRLWELDRRFLVVSRRPASDTPPPAEFRATATQGSPGPEPRPAWYAHRRIELEDATPLGGDPIAVETGPPGRVLVLDANPTAPPSTVRLVEPATGTTLTARLEEAAPDPGSTAFQLVAHDMALEAATPAGADDGRLGTLYVVDAEANQAFAFALRVAAGRLEAVLAHDYFPMRLFGGKALVAAPAGQGGAMYDFGDGWVPLVRQNRQRFATSATVPLDVFDGRLPGTVWHRLLIDGCIPPETSVVVESRAVDDQRELATASWQPEPALVYRRGTGSELAFTTPPAGGQEAWELLFQRARGRWLQLRLLLAGDGRSTPRLHALRAYYPRFSYLERYLPKVYREDGPSASFLDRFLANLEGLHTAIEDRIAASRALFDPRTAPADTLAWLLGWFDVTADPTWHEQRRRLFLAHAMEFFALRGTIPGIQLAIRLALDPCDDELLFAPETPRRHSSRIVERFRTRRTPAVVLGDPSELAGPRVVPQAPRWDPTQGREALLDRWRATVGDPAAEFPLADPSERWRGFLRDVVGVEPPDSFDPGLWTSFLAFRYGRIEALDAAYGTVGDGHRSFADVALPSRLPPDGPALRDWYQFVALVLPARRAAHRFTVLLPLPAADVGGGRSAEERRAIVQRVVDLQKPADTTFDIRFFWSAFRVGEVRLGEDTLVDLGSRDPRLRPPLVLGGGHAGEGHLGGTPPPTAHHAGRQPIQR